MVVVLVRVKLLVSVMDAIVVTKVSDTVLFLVSVRGCFFWRIVFFADVFVVFKAGSSFSL